MRTEGIKLTKRANDEAGPRFQETMYKDTSAPFDRVAHERASSGERCDKVFLHILVVFGDIDVDVVVLGERVLEDRGQRGWGCLLHLRGRKRDNVRDAQV